MDPEITRHQDYDDYDADDGNPLDDGAAMCKHTAYLPLAQSWLIATVCIPNSRRLRRAETALGR